VKVLALAVSSDDSKNLAGADATLYIPQYLDPSKQTAGLL